MSYDHGARTAGICLHTEVGHQRQLLEPSLLRQCRRDSRRRELVARILDLQSTRLMKILGVENATLATLSVAMKFTLLTLR